MLFFEQKLKVLRREHNIMRRTLFNWGKIDAQRIDDLDERLKILENKISAEIKEVKE